MRQVGNDSRARCAQRVSESWIGVKKRCQSAFSSFFHSKRYAGLTNGTAKDVGLVVGQLELLLHAEELGRKGLVDLPEVDLVLADSTALKGQLDGLDGPDAHDAGLAGRDAVRDDARQGLEAELLDGSLRSNDVGRGTIADARGVARRDGAVLLEDRGKLGEGLDRCLAARVLVDGKGLGGRLEADSGPSATWKLTSRGGHVPVKSLIKTAGKSESVPVISATLLMASVKASRGSFACSHILTNSFE